MSATMPTEYEVFKTLRLATILGLQTFGVSEGIDVRRFSQANITSGDKLVLMNLIGTDRIGWQAFRYSGVTGGRTDEWIEQQSWQFTCIKRMLNSDTVNTITSDDLAQALVAWYNGNGNLKIRESGLANLPINPSGVMVFMDDSDMYQRRAVFTMQVQVPKNFTTKADWVSRLAQSSYGV